MARMRGLAGRTCRIGTATSQVCTRWFRHIRAVALLVLACALLVFAFSVYLAFYRPIYVSPPPHYDVLANAIRNSRSPGSGNRDGEKVFIAANIVNAGLIRGAWGDSLINLVHILGPQNVFVSIYENDSGPETVQALRDLRSSLTCNTSIVTGEHIELNSLPKVALPAGRWGVKRIEYLALVRNLALRPLDAPHDLSPVDEANGFRYAEEAFDKILFLNDVYFHAEDAAQLLFSTGVSTNSKTPYQAACAVDFVSTTNYYDDYATRDLEGYGLGYGPGFRVFPWFSTSGSGSSRRAVLSGTDMVPVRSCWGGMVAFQASWFRQTPNSTQEPVRFRSTSEPYWDASECCLVHADISHRYSASHPDSKDVGIFINPFVRVAYEETTFHKLNTIRRFEHGFSIIQHLLTIFSQYPTRSERADEEAGDSVQRDEWSYEHGGYISTRRTADPGGFCGLREMAIMKEDFDRQRHPDERYYEVLTAPGGRWHRF